MSNSLANPEYRNWLVEIKSKVRSSHIKAALAVNSALITFYWELGKMITEKQTAWGSSFLEQLSKDLREEFPEMKGFSVTNIGYCRSLYLYFPIPPQPGGELQIHPQLGDELTISPHVEDTFSISPQVGGELEIALFQKIRLIPWGHVKLVIDKIKNLKEASFYTNKTIENNWSREVLALQIKSDLYNRSGKSISNFKNTLPQAQSVLAIETLKDPYIFDFLTLSETFKEKDIELQLVHHIRKFLLELGKGFAFVGQQYHLQIADNDYYIDLLFYHIRLKCYVVIELKNTAFKPEYTGKLNFYLSAVDSLLKQEDDKQTIGILLCRDKNNIEAEFALRDINKPIGVSEFQLTNILPENLKSSLPTIEEIEQNLLNHE